MSDPVVFAEVHGADGGALTAAECLGGTTSMPATEMPDGMLADPEGHVIGLVSPPAGSP
jgi:hypothetical protein